MYVLETELKYILKTHLRILTNVLNYVLNKWLDKCLEILSECPEVCPEVCRDIMLWENPTTLFKTSVQVVITMDNNSHNSYVKWTWINFKPQPYRYIWLLVLREMLVLREN